MTQYNGYPSRFFGGISVYQYFQNDYFVFLCDEGKPTSIPFDLWGTYEPVIVAVGFPSNPGDMGHMDGGSTFSALRDDR